MRSFISKIKWMGLIAIPITLIQHAENAPAAAQVLTTRPVQTVPNLVIIGTNVIAPTQQAAALAQIGTTALAPVPQNRGLGMGQQGTGTAIGQQGGTLVTPPALSPSTPAITPQSVQPSTTPQSVSPAISPQTVTPNISPQNVPQPIFPQNAPQAIPPGNVPQAVSPQVTPPQSRGLGIGRQGSGTSIGQQGTTLIGPQGSSAPGQQGTTTVPAPATGVDQQGNPIVPNAANANVPSTGLVAPRTGTGVGVIGPQGTIPSQTTSPLMPPARLNSNTAVRAPSSNVTPTGRK